MCCSDGCDMFGRWCAQPEAALTHYAGHGKETIIPVTRPPVTRPPVTCIPTHTINVHAKHQRAAVGPLTPLRWRLTPAARQVQCRCVDTGVSTAR